MSPHLSFRSATKRGYTPLASTSTLNLDNCPIDAPLRTEGLYRVHARTGDEEDERCESPLSQRTRDSLDILREKYRAEKVGEECEGTGKRANGALRYFESTKLRGLKEKGKKWVNFVCLKGA
jgi:hypothetical protein